MSYASKDREEVLKRVQMLEVLKMKFFQDILMLDPDNRWEKTLYENIDRCNLFLLFWSQAAKDSQWILKEAEYALAHQQKNKGGEPDLVPVVLEQHVSPPSSLSAFHFNDRVGTSLRTCRSGPTPRYRLVRGHRELLPLRSMSRGRRPTLLSRRPGFSTWASARSTVYKAI